MNSVTRACACKMQLSMTISIILCICRLIQGFIVTFLCGTGTVLKSSLNKSDICESRRSGNIDWPWTHQKCMKKTSQKMKECCFSPRNTFCRNTYLVIGNWPKWGSRLKYILRNPVRRSVLHQKTNLSLAPARQTLCETKQVLCRCLQQGHEARLATSRLEGMDFTTDLGIYLTVSMEWRYANGCLYAVKSKISGTV